MEFDLFTFSSIIGTLVWIGKTAASYRLKTSLQTDKRVRLMNEIIQGIQVIKFFAWEQPFAKTIKEIRSREINGVRGSLYLRAIIYSFNFISKLSIFICLISYLYLGNIFTASSIFIVTSYFNLLYTSMLQFWPMAVTHVCEGFISIRRIQTFLSYNDTKPVMPTVTNKQSHDDEKDKIDENNDENNVEEKLLMEIKAATTKISTVPKRILNQNLERKGIFMRNASATWSDDKQGLNCDYLELSEQKLYGIVGQVGAGKSTLLHVILGELELDSGEIEINGTVSYSSQDPWIFEGTIRQNILFIEKFDEDRYGNVIKVCSLERDLELFTNGDETFVGERGSTLSGGQKARINLARCLYRNTDIYLLDDPLSAVDVKVGKFIYENAIKKFLKVTKLSSREFLLK